MRVSTFGKYPSLGQFFTTVEKCAEAGCMGRKRLWECLNGKKQFTPAEQKAIVSSIISRMALKQIDNAQIEGMVEALADFDGYFKVKE